MAPRSARLLPVLLPTARGRGARCGQSCQQRRNAPSALLAAYVPL